MTETTKSKRETTWRVHVRLSEAARAQLTRLANETKLVHETNKRPRDAEILRVLLVSILLPGGSFRERAARALASNVTIVLSAELSGVVAKLTNDVELLAASKFKNEIGGNPSSMLPDKIDVPRSRTPFNKAPDQQQVLVTLDNWLREKILQFYAGAANTTTAIRADVERALVNKHEYDQHMRVVVAYASGIEGAKKIVRDAAEAGLEAVRDVLAKDHVGHTPTK